MSLEDKLGMLETVSLPAPDPEAEVTITQASFEQSQVYELAKKSLDFLASLAAPDMVKYLFPPVFIVAWNWLLSYIHKERDFSKLALGLPRGFGKTTFIKFFLLYCILFTKRSYLIVISANEKLAINIITDVCSMLSNRNIKAVFGDWSLGVETNTQDTKVFGFRGRTIILQAIGKNGAIRGTNKANARPDVMIFEDIQTREEAESQVVSESIERWMIGTAMKAKSPSGCLYIFVANMYPTRWSILRKLKSNPSWTKFIVGGILEDGKSLWEELQPLEQLLEEFESDLNAGHPEIFYSEVLNDENANINTSIDLSKIPEYSYDDAEVSLGDYVVIDPSNDKANSDFVSIGHFRIIDGKPVLMHLVEDRLSPGDTIREAYKMCFIHGCSLIAIESNAYQYSLLYWFEFIGRQLEVQGVVCVPIYSGSLSKVTRILNMFKELVAGDLLVHPLVRTQVYYQISQFNALRRDNVDGILDLLTYANRVMTDFLHYIVTRSPLGLQDVGTARVWSVEENCDF